MNTYESRITARNTVEFPEPQGDRIYMLPFTKSGGLPASARRWQGVVDQMLEGVDTTGPVYLMVDEGLVRAGTAQRRPGLHIDGYWDPSGRHQEHRPGLGCHRPNPNERGHSPRPPTHRPAPGRHGVDGAKWADAEFKDPEAIMLVSSVSAAQGYVGTFHGPIGEGGDCSHLGVAGLERMPFLAGTVYAGNVTALHESLPVEVDCVRQLVRLNVPGWEGV